MAGIYFHIPFCKRICAYCDFYKCADLSLMDAAEAAMHRELDIRSRFLGDRRIKTIYFGGGTPSLYRPQILRDLTDHAARLFDCSALEECTVEVNPDDLTEEYAAALIQSQINRLSIGVQSFDDDELRLMNRRHSASQAIEAVKLAKRAGFGNITIDLIFGVPDFGKNILEKSINEALELGVQHISAYHLTIEPNTAFGRRAAANRMTPVDDGTSEEEYGILHRRLTAAGFEHYEVSNYALDGFRANHNSSYWTGAEYLGIGPAAHSFDGKRRCWNEASVEKYITGEAAYECESLSETDRYNEYVMTSLRTAEGADRRKVLEEFGTRRYKLLSDAGEAAMKAGNAVCDEGRIRIPADRFLVSDAVIEKAFDTAKCTFEGRNAP